MLNAFVIPPDDRFQIRVKKTDKGAWVGDYKLPESTETGIFAWHSFKFLFRLNIHACSFKEGLAVFALMQQVDAAAISFSYPQEDMTDDAPYFLISQIKRNFNGDVVQLGPSKGLLVRVEDESFEAGALNQEYGSFEELMS